MDEKLLELFRDELNDEVNEKLLEKRIEYFARLLKKGLKVEDILEVLDISDNDYKAIYPMALKLAQ